MRSARALIIVSAANLALLVLGLGMFILAFHVGQPFPPAILCLWLLPGWAVAAVHLVMALLGHQARRDPGFLIAATLSAACVLPYVTLGILWANRLYLPLQ